MDPGRKVLGQGPSPPCLTPTHIAGQGADEGHEKSDQASLCLQALPILQVKNSAWIIKVLPVRLNQQPFSTPVPAPHLQTPNIPQRAGRSKENCSAAGRRYLHPGRGAPRETRSGQPA